jgi:hypothetical protein
MKKTIFILFLSILMLSNVYSQTSVKLDTCFQKPQIINIYNNIRVLEYKDSIQTKLLNEYQFQVNDYRSIMLLDSTTIENQKIQINNLQENAKTWKTLYNTVKPSWYEKPLTMLISGIVGAAIIVNLK